MNTEDLLTILLIVLIGCLVYQCMKRSLREGVRDNIGGIPEEWEQKVESSLGGKVETCQTGLLDQCHVDSWDNLDFPIHITTVNGKRYNIDWKEMQPIRKNTSWGNFCGEKNQGQKLCKLSCNLKTTNQPLKITEKDTINKMCYACSNGNCSKDYQGYDSEDNCQNACQKPTPTPTKYWECQKANSGTCTQTSTVDKGYKTQADCQASDQCKNDTPTPTHTH